MVAADLVVGRVDSIVADAIFDTVDIAAWGCGSTA